jgi:integrase
MKDATTNVNEQGIIDQVRARRHPRLPVVMSQDEVRWVWAEMSGTHLLMAKLLYAGVLRLMECVRLRMQDEDFARGLLCVRAAKGDKDRSTLFPISLHEELKSHLDRVKSLHDGDLAMGLGAVYLPEALSRKYPGASRDVHWQYVFPAKTLSIDPRTGVQRRHHVMQKDLDAVVSPLDQLAFRPSSGPT